RTITPEERRQFLEKSHQQKLKTIPTQPDPLTQLIVDDDASKGAKRKKKTETGRISMEIAVKESTAAVVEKGEVAEVVQPASKKRKVSNAATGEAA
ncbi:hypothetical protein A2U01_0075942, partial [Trifolium medium]|nr:hypothetical protein [Trifolium medium]